MFDVSMMPDETGAVTGRLEIDLDVSDAEAEPDWNALAAALSSNVRGVGLALTQTMFRFPWHGWKLEAVAARLDTTPRMLQMALFREAYSFDATLRRCRRLNSLLQIGHAHCTFSPARKDQRGCVPSLAPNLTDAIHESHMELRRFSATQSRVFHCDVDCSSPHEKAEDVRLLAL